MTRERGGPHEGYLTIESFQVRRACRSQRGVRAGRCCGQISGSSVVDRHASSARRVDPDIRAICDLVRILLAIWPLTRSLCPGHGGLMGGFSVSGQGCCTCCFAGVCVWHASGCLVGLSVVPRGDRTAALGGGSTPFDWLRLFHTAVSHQYHVKPRAPDSFTLLTRRPRTVTWGLGPVCCAYGCPAEAKVRSCGEESLASGAADRLNLSSCVFCVLFFLV